MTRKHKHIITINNIMSSKTTTSNISKNIILLKWFNFFLDLRFYSPIAVIYFAHITGSFVLGMSIFSVIMITQSVFELPMGIFSDNIGRKKTMIIGALFGVIGITSYAIGLSYAFLLLGAFTEGMARTFFSGNNNALLYETLKQDNREEEFAEVSGKVSSMFQAGLSVAALVGAGIAMYFSLSLLFWLTVISQLASLVISFLIIEPLVHTDKIKQSSFVYLRGAFVKFIGNKHLRTFSFATAINHGVGESMHEFQPAFIATLWPEWAVGIYRFLTNAFAFISFRFSGFFIKLTSLANALLMASGLSNFLMFVGILLGNIFSPIIFAISSLSFGVYNTARETLMQKEFSETERATMGSLNAMVGSIMVAIAALLLGLVADVYGVVVAMLCGQVVLLFTLYLNYRVFTIKKSLKT